MLIRPLCDPHRSLLLLCYLCMGYRNRLVFVRTGAQKTEFYALFPPGPAFCLSLPTPPRGREQPFPFSISGLFFILYFSCVAIRAIIVADLVCAGSLSMHSPAPLSDPFGLSDSALFYIDGSFSQSCKGSAFPNLRCAAMRRAARCRERCTVTKNMNRGNQNQL